MELLRHKPIDRIKIKEICDRAYIDRSTFYRHFENIYDLLNYVLEDAFEGIFPHNFLLEPNSEKTAENILSMIKAYRQTIRNIIQRTEFIGKVLQAMSKIFEGRLYDELVSLNLENDTWAILTMKSFCGACTRMMLEWTDNDKIEDNIILEQSKILLYQLKTNIFCDK